MNALADASRGLVWRLQTEDGDATAIRPYDDDLVIVNLSVWQSVEPIHCLWWVGDGNRSSVAEAIERPFTFRDARTPAPPDGLRFGSPRTGSARPCGNLSG